MPYNQSRAERLKQLCQVLSLDAILLITGFDGCYNLESKVRRPHGLLVEGGACWATYLLSATATAWMRTQAAHTHLVLASVQLLIQYVTNVYYSHSALLHYRALWSGCAIPQQQSLQLTF